MVQKPDIPVTRASAARLPENLLYSTYAPDVPTRYLFARGRLELARGDLESARATATEIRTYALPPEEQDFTEEMAASYLEAMASLAAGETETALERARTAVELDGYRYFIYRTALVEALRRQGQLGEAADVAAEATAERDWIDPRLDLELDRMRLILIESEIRMEMGETVTAERLARAFLERWSRSERDHPDVARARRLAGPS